MTQRYKIVGDIADMMLAGCLKDMNAPGNYETLRDRLRLMLALYLTEKQANGILKQIDKEAKPLAVKLHEYVINELQYEYRLAKSRGKMDIDHEDRVLELWQLRLSKHFPANMVAEFMEKLKSNRLNRDRSPKK